MIEFSKMSLATLLFGILIATTQPDPRVTPGDVCKANDPDFDGYVYSEKIAHCKRNFSEAKKASVARVYGVPKANWSDYEFDHLIPLCVGGSNDVRNVWPEPIEHAHRKDVIEDKVCAALRAGTMTQKEAVQEVFTWVQNNFQATLTNR